MQARDRQDAPQRLPAAARFWSILLLPVAAALLLLVVFDNLFEVKDGAGYARSASLQNLHAIQLALERYACDNAGYYPLDFVELAKQGYLSVNPDNEYALHRAGEDQARMQLVPPGMPGTPGDFAYVTSVQNTTEGPRVTAYKLVLYGRKADERFAARLAGIPGVDASRAIFVLEGPA